MTDQATEQSGATSNDAAPDLAAFFQQTLNGGQPKGQAQAAEGEEDDESESGASPEVDGEQAEGEIPAKFRVPALEGDGFEELTAEEIKAQRLMQADYTRKTQEVAEARKAVQAEKEKVLTVLNQRAQEAETHLQMLAGAITSFDQQVNWEELRATDPATYLQAREQQQARMQAFERTRQHFAQIQEEQRRERVQSSSQRLVEAMPELLDPNTAKAFGEQITTAANKFYGFTPQEVAGVEDHRLILMMRDAAKYHELKDKAGQIKATVEKAPQLAKPGAPRQGNPEALRVHRTIQKAKGSSSLEDQAAAFDAMFGKRK